MAWTHELCHEKTRTPRPVTLPTLKLTGVDDTAIEEETRAAAERTAVTRTIRQGRDAWERIGDANSFSAWCKIGAALAIGKAYALRTTGANCAWGATYSGAFNKWMAEYGFGAMRPSDRSYAVALHENLQAIEQWRATLPDKQRRRLRGAQQNVKRWRRETQQAIRRDDVTRALVAWRQFKTCLAALPPEQAAAVWQQTVVAEVTAVADAA